MLIIENFMLAINSLRSNKMRALLTMLGIIIGISSVIAIVSIGNSVSKQTEDEMKNFGMNNLSCSLTYKGTNDDGEVDYDNMGSPTQDDMITMSILKEYQNSLKDEVKAISVESSVGSGEARMDSGVADQVTVNVTGINDGYSVINKIKVIKGRDIQASDVSKETDVAVVPAGMVDKLVKDSSNPIGQEVRIVFDDKILTYTIVGVYDDSQKSGMMFGGYQDKSSLYIPFTSAQNINGEQGVNYFTVMPKSDGDAQKLTEDTTAYFSNIYKNNKEWGVDVYNSQKDASDVMNSINKIKIAIAVIAGIALLVGGIGVMNIMLVSVTERTREIGVRKAIGAKRSHIKTQFIIEAIIICGIGGIIGVVLGLLLSTAIALKMNLPVAISIPVIIISVLFSMGIGVFFGFYPANKAAKLDPIEALRYE